MIFLCGYDVAKVRCEYILENVGTIISNLI